MLLAQGRYWRLALSKSRQGAVLSLQRDQLPEDLQEARDLKIEIPLSRWNSVVKHADSDRKLLGGVLLDYASPKDRLARVIASDRLLVELQRLVRDATVTMIEKGILVLSPVEEES